MGVHGERCDGSIDGGVVERESFVRDWRGEGWWEIGEEIVGEVGWEIVGEIG